MDVSPPLLLLDDDVQKEGKEQKQKMMQYPGIKQREREREIYRIHNPIVEEENEIMFHIDTLRREEGGWRRM